jgi:large subunit ribosomal protein L28
MSLCHNLPSYLLIYLREVFYMSFRCELTGKGPAYGNQRSHSNRKSRRRWMPNLQNKAIWVEELKRSVNLRLTAHAIKIIAKRGGLIAAVHAEPEANLSAKLLKIKRLAQKSSKKAKVAKQPVAEKAVS